MLSLLNVSPSVDSFQSAVPFAVKPTTPGTALVLVMAFDNAAVSDGSIPSIVSNAGDVFVPLAGANTDDVGGGSLPQSPLFQSINNTDIWWCPVGAGGATTVTITAADSFNAWLYEYSGTAIEIAAVGCNTSLVDANGIIAGPGPGIAFGPSLLGQQAQFTSDGGPSTWSVSSVAIQEHANPGVVLFAHVVSLAWGGSSSITRYTGISSPFVFDPPPTQTGFGTFFGFGAGHTGVPAPPPPPPPPNPPPCAPVDSHNMLTSGVLIDDLSLFIGPATALYKTPILPNLINSYETTTEGRHEIVLDFNAGDGLCARDLGTVFSWPLNTPGKAKTILYTWQPAIIAMPEGSYGRATDWMDGGTNGAKFIQGVMIEADSFNNPKTFFLQDSDTLGMHALNETPATFNKQSEKAFSCTPPFVAHSARIISTDGVEWRVWSSKLVFQPWPEMALNWQTEMTSLGLTGWGHVREMNLPYVSTAPVTLVLTFDAWPTITLTLASTSGVQNKTKLTLPPNKFKLMSLRAFSAQGFRLFEKDLELKIKAWGTTEAYTIVRPFGGPSRAGAVV